MHNDSLDAILYATRYLGRFCIEQIEQEEDKMDAPGKLRNDLKRIFGNADPLNYIDDISVQTDGRTHQLVITVDVPDSCVRYLESSPLYRRCWYRMGGTTCVGTLDPGGKPPVAETTESSTDDCNTPVMPDRVVYSGPNTFVFWPDGTKTAVKLMDGQEYDEYSAFCAAVTKKLFGSTPKAKQFLNKVKKVQPPAMLDKYRRKVRAVLNDVFNELQETVEVDAATRDRIVCDLTQIVTMFEGKLDKMSPAESALPRKFMSTRLGSVRTAIRKLDRISFDYDDNDSSLLDKYLERLHDALDAIVL